MEIVKNLQLLTLEGKDGQLDGHGIFIDKGGDKYDGTWKNDKKDGTGTYYWGQGRWTGHIFHGEWSKGKIQGQGRYTFPSGAFYDGEWKDDNFNGKGV